jgi:hypothetical protein
MRFASSLRLAVGLSSFIVATVAVVERTARADDASSDGSFDDATVDASAGDAADAADAGDAGGGRANGATCTSASQCGSGFCVDGVCCDRACDGVCEACDGSEIIGLDGGVTPIADGGVTPGRCIVVHGVPHGARVCPPAVFEAGVLDVGGDGAASICAQPICDGANGGFCGAFPDLNTKCGAPSCSSSTVLAAPACDGMGNCLDGPTSPCDPYNCSSGTCTTSCTQKSDCAPLFQCIGGACAQPGPSCSSDRTQSTDSFGLVDQCTPYFCATSNGQCAHSCGTNAECQSGFHCDVNSSLCIAGAPTPTSNGGGSGGCNAGSARGAKLGWPLLGAVLALGAAGLRRRRGAERRATRSTRSAR